MKNLTSMLVICTLLSSWKAARAMELQIEQTDVIAIAQAKNLLHLGKRYVKSKEYERAKKLFEEALQQDDDEQSAAWACMQLAKLYYFGWGVEKDRALAIDYVDRGRSLGYGLEMIVYSKILKDDGFDITKDYALGGTALHSAAAEGQCEVVELLVQMNAPRDYRDKMWDNTPLRLALENFHQEVVYLLIELGVPWNKLHRATLQRDLEFVSELLKVPEAAHEVDQHKLTALHIAASNGHSTLLKMLLLKGAHVNAADEHKYTPLHWAAMSGKKEAIELLLAHKADLKSQDYYGRTALYVSADRGNREAVELLVSRGGSIHTGDSYGDTPLHRAVVKKHTRTAALLLALGADRKALNSVGKTPYDLAWHEEIRSLFT